MAVRCEHVGEIREVRPTGNGCKECLETGQRWIQLRECMTCGHVGCCDSSPGRHARAHFEHMHHPIIKSFEPAQDWFWCYVDRTYVEPRAA